MKTQVPCSHKTLASVTSDHRPGDKLICQEQDSLETEPPRAEVEEILEAGAEQLHHHHVVVAWEQARVRE